MRNAAAQKEIFSLAGLLDGFTVNLSKPDIRPSSGDGISIPIYLGNDGRNLERWWAGVLHPVREGGEDFCGVTTRATEGFSIITTREKELPRQNRVSQLSVVLYATVRAREACLPAVITSLNECRLTVITVPDEPHLNVISSSNEGLSNISNGLNQDFSDISTASNEDFNYVTTREKELAILKVVSSVFGTVRARNEGLSDITTRDREGFLVVTTRDRTVSVSQRFDNSGQALVGWSFATSTHKAGIEFCQSIKKSLIEFLESIKKGPTEFLEQYAHTRARDYTEFSGTLEQVFCNSIKKECARRLESAKKDLPLFRLTVYGNSAPAKSGAGIGVLECLSATHDAPSVFFCVVRIAQPFFSSTVIIRAAYQVMVGCSGAEKSAPVSDNAGYANPVQSITSEIGVSGDGIYTQLSEAAIWLLPPPKNHLLSGAFTLASNHAISLLPLALNPKRVLCYLMPHVCLQLASVQEAHMLNQFTVLGYGTNQRGLTIGINYKITSDSTAKATAHAMLQAQRDGLTRIRITRVMGATA